MDEQQPSGQTRVHVHELLYFWALGDLHYYNHISWQAAHGPRMHQMFHDLQQLWSMEGEPTFCVSPGDIIDFGEPEHYQLARQEIATYLSHIPFYPGVGNHELFTNNQESEAELLEDFATFWEMPPRYYWVEGEVLCIMLDVVGYGKPKMTAETLDFLDTALVKHPGHMAVIFAHCPLYATVLDRDPVQNLDYDSLEPFFYVENSAQVREVLARHANACLYISGHTHTGWQAPQLVFTETLGAHTITHVSLSSPWYTGRGRGFAWAGDHQSGEYRADEPDMIVSLAVHIARNQVHVQLRDHRAASWLAEWKIPVG